MPADGRAGSILVDERHRKRFGVDASPLRDRRAQWQQERWKRPLRAAIVRLAEERDAPPRDDATQFEVRERDAGDGVQQGLLIGLSYEVRAIVEASRAIVVWARVAYFRLHGSPRTSLVTL